MNKYKTTYPGLEDMIITKEELVEGTYHIHLERQRTPARCPRCTHMTSKVHDYRIQKIQHTKLFERPTVLFYRKRRYACSCGKRFAEHVEFVDRYQRYSKEWNQLVQIRTTQEGTFTQVAKQQGCSIPTVMRRFKKLISETKHRKQLPRHVAIDEYKGDTDAGKFQLLIANAETKEPIDILPDRRKDTIKRYFQRYGWNVEIVVMDMSSSFRAAIEEAIERPIIIADRFHFVRYVYWSLDTVRRTVQKTWHAYNRKSIKRSRTVLYKRNLSPLKRKELMRYLSYSEELTEAYQLKESFVQWFDQSKESKDISEVKKGLIDWYEEVLASNCEPMKRTVMTFKRWQTEILNSFVYGYTNGFVEGLNNKTKVIKRAAYGFRSFDHFRAKILLSHKYKNIGSHLG